MEEIKLNVNGVELTTTKDELSQAVESGSLELKSDNVIVKTKEDHDTFMGNIDLEKKAKYDEGTEVGEKRAVNSALEKFGITLDDQKKTVDNFGTAFKAKIIEESGKEPTQKIKDLETDNEKLRTNFSNLENDFNTYKSSITEQETSRKKDAEILGAIPKDGLLIGQDEVALIFKNRYDIGYGESGNIEIKKDGQVLKNNTTLNPLGVSDVMQEFIKPYIKKADGGGGGGDDTGNNTAGSYDAFVKEMSDKGHSEGSADFQTEMTSRMKNGTLKM
jgi:hypothetical protein